MAFYGYEFIFDGIPSLKYDLMLYDIGSNNQDDIISIPSAAKLVKDRISRRNSSLLYGVEKNEPLSFNLIFGATPKRMENNIPFDRFEVEAITSWLTGHTAWKWLKIDQPDLDGVRYKCLITELKQISYGNYPWAFTCTVECDSPYAYRAAHPIEYTCSGASTDIIFRNPSSHNGIYYPIVEIELNGATEIEIINHSNCNSYFKFSDIPVSVHKITVDNQNGVITTDADVNIYGCFNFNFLGLVRGGNRLTVNGKCVLRFICDFPVNIGG